MQKFRIEEEMKSFFTVVRFMQVLDPDFYLGFTAKNYQKLGFSNNGWFF